MRQHVIVEIPGFLWSHRRQASGNCMRNCEALAVRAASVEGAGGTGGHKRAWLRRPWAAAGPGRTTSRRAEPHISDQAPPVWRAPEGQAAVPVGGGGAWPGFEPTRRAKLAARTASGRAAAHGHTKQPGPQDSTRGARNTRGTTSTVQKVRTPRSTPGSGRPGGRRGGRVH